MPEKAITYIIIDIRCGLVNKICALGNSPIYDIFINMLYPISMNTAKKEAIGLNIINENRKINDIMNNGSIIILTSKFDMMKYVDIEWNW